MIKHMQNTLHDTDHTSKAFIILWILSKELSWDEKIVQKSVSGEWKGSLNTLHFPPRLVNTGKGERLEALGTRHRAIFQATRHSSYIGNVEYFIKEKQFVC